jgi:hypothetical protein
MLNPDKLQHSNQSTNYRTLFTQSYSYVRLSNNQYFFSPNEFEANDSSQRLKYQSLVAVK